MAGRVAVVTGASGGIGAACAITLARDGWDIVVGFRSDKSAAAAVGDQVRAAGRSARLCRADVASQTDVAALFSAADELGPLGALVNNAGIVDQRSRLEDMAAERIRRIMEVNVVGAFLCAGQAVRRLSTRRGGAGGVIVNISSAASRLGSPDEYIDYAASKGAVDVMTIGLAKEVGGEGIRVNAVRPGIVDTGIHARSGQPDKAQQRASSIPLGRAGRPEEVAEAVAWLCSDRAAYVTGAILDVAGGR